MMRKKLLVLALGIMASYQIALALETKNQDGQTSFETICLSCHGRTAPPMFVIKKHYLKRYPDREVFMRQIGSWVRSPSPNKALMPHALEKHGMMPAQLLDDEVLAKVAAYIYDTQLKQGHGQHQGKGNCSDHDEQGSRSFSAGCRGGAGCGSHDGCGRHKH